MRRLKRFSKNRRKSFGRTKPIRRYSKKIKNVELGVSLLSLGLGLGLGLYMLGNTQKNNGTPEEIAKYYGYRINDKIIGDGTCMFRSVADQLHGDQECFLNYRLMAVKYLTKIIEQYPEVKERITATIAGEYEGMTLEKYLFEMETTNMWGDHKMLQALSNLLEIRIIVIHFNSIVQRTEIVPTDFSTNAKLLMKGGDMALGLYGENHYVSLHKI